MSRNYSLHRAISSDYGWLESCRGCNGCNFEKVSEDSFATEYRCRTDNCRLTTIVYKIGDEK